MVRIILDSSADLTKEELQARNIELVPMSVTFGEDNYKAGIDLDSEKFFELLTSTDEFPKTAQPSIQDYLDIFEEAKESGDDVVVVSISSALSGTYQSILLAKDMAEYDRIYVVDSKSATVGVRIIGEYADKLRSEGLDGAEIFEKLEEMKGRVKIVAGIDTLEYLSKGGRISKAAAAIGEVANLKPIITVEQDGSLSIIKKCVGRNKALSFIMNTLEACELDSEFPVYSIHSYGTDNVERLEAKMAAAGIPVEVRGRLGATIGAHIGPGAFGFVVVLKGV